MTMQETPLTAGHRRGDVVLVPFPNSDLKTAKLRPALIVQADGLDTGLAQIVIAMISSNLNRTGHRSRVLIETASETGRQSGLLFDSVLMCDNLATIMSKMVTRKIGSIHDLNEADTALRHTLGL
ncbi:MAG: type II toxin-antitoxin system PemK/MazF family toxin [Acidobacteria bacterium]|nr:type II toxin-antitoxin system PemK/MazF family toxin [Acidobacteriota bacterium]